MLSYHKANFCHIVMFSTCSCVCFCFWGVGLKIYKLGNLMSSCIMFLLSTYRIRGKSNPEDLKLAAEVCMPIIHAVLAELKNKTFPEGSFLNIDVPTDVINHKVILKYTISYGLNLLSIVFLKYSSLTYRSLSD